MTASTFNSRNAIIRCLVEPELTPLLMKPPRDRWYELTTDIKILDGHE